MGTGSAFTRLVCVILTLEVKYHFRRPSAEFQVLSQPHDFHYFLVYRVDEKLCWRWQHLSSISFRGLIYILWKHYNLQIQEKCQDNQVEDGDKGNVRGWTRISHKTRLLDYHQVFQTMVRNKISFVSS